MKMVHSLNETEISRKSDKELVMLVLAGSGKSFEILMRRYNQLLFRVVRSYIKSHEVVQDIMQDTYLKCFKNLSQYQGNAAFSTWLIRIGINEALQYQRKQNYLRSNSELALASVDLKRPDLEYQNKELKWLLEEAIQKLPHGYRTIFVLFELEGLKCSEIGACMDLSLGAVKVRLHRARTMLRQYLLEKEDLQSLYEFGNKNCDRLVAKVLDCIRLQCIIY